MLPIAAFGIIAVGIFLAMYAMINYATSQAECRDTCEHEFEEWSQLSIFYECRRCNKCDWIELKERPQ